MPAARAAKSSLVETAPSILTSALILTSAGFLLGMMSSNGIIGQLGILVGRGGILSGVLVLFALPPLVAVFDKAIAKTTLHVNFYKGEEKNEHEEAL